MLFNLLETHQQQQNTNPYRLIHPLWLSGLSASIDNTLEFKVMGNGFKSQLKHQH